MAPLGLLLAYFWAPVVFFLGAVWYLLFLTEAPPGLLFGCAELFLGSYWAYRDLLVEFCWTPPEQLKCNCVPPGHRLVTSSWASPGTFMGLLWAELVCYTIHSVSCRGAVEILLDHNRVTVGLLLGDCSAPETGHYIDD